MSEKEEEIRKDVAHCIDRYGWMENHRYELTIDIYDYDDKKRFWEDSSYRLDIANDVRNGKNDGNVAGIWWRIKIWGI